MSRNSFLANKTKNQTPRLPYRSQQTPRRLGMTTPHHAHIGTAFLQLSFAIKLWTFLKEHPIDKDKFDIDLTIQSPGNCVVLPGGEFHTYQDLQLASEHKHHHCFWRCCHHALGGDPRAQFDLNKDAQSASRPRREHGRPQLHASVLFCTRDRRACLGDPRQEIQNHVSHRKQDYRSISHQRWSTL